MLDGLLRRPGRYDKREASRPGRASDAVGEWKQYKPLVPHRIDHRGDGLPSSFRERVLLLPFEQLSH